jgi:hypothetical protein
MEAMTPAEIRAEFRELISELNLDDAIRLREVVDVLLEVLDRLPRQDDRDMFAALLSRYTGRDETAAVTPRACACGCGEPVTSPRPEARYATGACRVRAHRERA